MCLWAALIIQLNACVIPALLSFIKPVISLTPPISDVVQFVSPLIFFSSLLPHFIHSLLTSLVFSPFPLLAKANCQHAFAWPNLGVFVYFIVFVCVLYAHMQSLTLCNHLYQSFSIFSHRWKERIRVALECSCACVSVLTCSICICALKRISASHNFSKVCESLGVCVFMSVCVFAEAYVFKPTIPAGTVYSISQVW